MSANNTLRNLLAMMYIGAMIDSTPAKELPDTDEIKQIGLSKADEFIKEYEPAIVHMHRVAQLAQLTELPTLQSA